MSVQASIRQGRGTSLGAVGGMAMHLSEAETLSTSPSETRHLRILAGLDRDLSAAVMQAADRYELAQILQRRTGRQVLLDERDDQARAAVEDDRILTGSVSDRRALWALGDSVPVAARFKLGERWAATVRADCQPTVAVLSLEADLSEEWLLVALEMTAIAATTVLAMQQRIAEAEVTAWEDLAADLLSAPCSERVEALARRLHYDLSVPLRVALVRPEEPSRALASSTEQAARRLKLRDLLMTERAGTMVVVVDQDVDWEQFAFLVSEGLGCGVSVGVGNAVDYRYLPSSLHGAQTSLSLSSVLGREPGVTRYDDLGIWRLFGSDDLPAMQQEIDRRIGPLIRYDRQHGSELLRTLSTYLACSCAHDAAAHALVIHRNTLKYRLKRIEALVGCALADAEDRFHLDFACRAWTTVQALSSESGCDESRLIRAAAELCRESG